MNHTPTPYKWIGTLLTADGESKVIGEFHCDKRLSHKERTDEKDYIVRACNAHEALVAALETAEGFRYSSPETWYPAVAAALKLAKGDSI